MDNTIKKMTPEEKELFFKLGDSGIAKIAVSMRKAERKKRLDAARQMFTMGTKPLMISQSEFMAKKRAALLMQMLEPTSLGEFGFACKLFGVQPQTIYFFKKFPYYTDLIKLFSGAKILSRERILNSATDYLLEKVSTENCEKTKRDLVNLLAELKSYK